MSLSNKPKSPGLGCETRFSLRLSSSSPTAASCDSRAAGNHHANIRGERVSRKLLPLSYSVLLWDNEPESRSRSRSRSVVGAAHRSLKHSQVRPTLRFCVSVPISDLTAPVPEPSSGHGVIFKRCLYHSRFGPVSNSAPN